MRQASEARTGRWTDGQLPTVFDACHPQDRLDRGHEYESRGQPGKRLKQPWNDFLLSAYFVLAVDVKRFDAIALFSK